MNFSPTVQLTAVCDLDLVSPLAVPFSIQRIGNLVYMKIASFVCTSAGELAIVFPAGTVPAAYCPSANENWGFAVSSEAGDAFTAALWKVKPNGEVSLNALDGLPVGDLTIESASVVWMINS